MWSFPATIALFVIAAVVCSSAEHSTPTSSLPSQNGTEDRHTFSFTITDVRSAPNESDSQHNSDNRVKRQQRLPSSDETSSTTTSEPIESTQPSNRSSGQESGQQQGHQQQGHQRWETSSTQNRRAQTRYPYRSQDQSNRIPTRRPSLSNQGPSAGSSWGSDSRYSQQPGQGSNDYRSRDRQGQAPSNQNIALEIELLRFSNDRALLADNRPCSPSGSECSYEISGDLQSGDVRSGNSAQSKSVILTTPPKSGSVDILMRTRRTFCNLITAGQPVTLRVEVKTADASRQRNTRQVREPTTTESDQSTTMDQNPDENEFSSTTEIYNSEDAQNRIGQPSQSGAEDQYSRDRYGDDQVSPQQGLGVDSRRLSVPDQSSGSRGGEVADSFECVINLSSAGQQQAHTAQWRTANCRPLFTNHMELMFRYTAYSIDASDCQQTRLDEPLMWTPMIAG